MFPEDNSRKVEEAILSQMHKGKENMTSSSVQPDSMSSPVGAERPRKTISLSSLVKASEVVQRCMDFIKIYTSSMEEV